MTFKGAERNVTDLQPKDRDIAMVFQNFALYPHMSVADNMAFTLRINTNDRSTPPARQAPAPEMQAWTAPEAAHFLAWADVDDRDLGMGWQFAGGHRHAPRRGVGTPLARRRPRPRPRTGKVATLRAYRAARAPTLISFATPLSC